VDPVTDESEVRLYDGEGDGLLQADKRSDCLIILPSGDPRRASKDRDRIRIQWGQHLLADLVAGVPSTMSTTPTASWGSC
jgi:hypothetical protein